MLIAYATIKYSSNFPNIFFSLSALNSLITLMNLRNRTNFNNCAFLYNSSLFALDNVDSIIKSYGKDDTRSIQNQNFR